MAGGITYNGIAVVNGGQIFDGLKFWVAQRVPTRSTIVDYIQTNSGTVVLLEKQADYLIADHARKDAPSGAISWKFITESVDNGVVQIPDRYKIEQVPAGPRRASSSRPTKGTRTAFTTEEDEALASWVLAHGNHKTGNEIYIALEEKYPSHPWQSWRNRYIKKLSLLPHDALLQMAARGGNHSALQSTDSEAQDQELPDPTALMLQRKGQRVQKETALQRNQERAHRVERKAAALPAPPALPTSRAQLGQQQEVVEEADVATTTAKNQFYDDLQWYSEENGIEIAPTQQIAGQPVELWDLSKAVSEQNLPAEEIDWFLVAEGLGYNWLDVKAAINALQRCYEENLAEFLAVMQDAFDDQPEEEPGAAEAQGADRDVLPSSRGNLPSSPPARFLANKRGFDTDIDLDPPLPTKRRRLNLPNEIPSTPEKHATPNTNRTIRVSTTTPLQFETQMPNLQTYESDVDVTPSQQLQSEHERIISSPIPLHLNNAARNRQMGRASATTSSASKQSNTSVKRRVLPGQFRSRQATIPEEQQQREQDDSLVVHNGNDDDEREVFVQPFPGAITSAQPPPGRPIGRPAQVVAAQRRKTPDEELAELIEYYESLGYAHKTVIESLRRTTMTPGLATVVMQSIQEGNGVPAHHEGIWTDRDDEGLRLVNEVGDTRMKTLLGSKEEMRRIRKARRTRDRLRDKHGQERMTLRMQFLEANDAFDATQGQSS